MGLVQTMGVSHSECVNVWATSKGLVVAHTLDIT